VQARVEEMSDQLVDFRSLIARYSFAEHAARADKYFSTLDLKSPVARKPFASPAEASELCGGLAVLLPNLLLYPGVRILDFGAGTCWMSRILALLGCEVTAADVSRKALEVGEQLIRSDVLGRQLKVDFVQLDAPELPFADATFDRVICFDALHHVPDQQGAIREFGRVLKDGGIAALHEPGPNHSRSSQSQYEMRMHDVIEADVRADELIEAALSGDFTAYEMAIFSTQAVKADLSAFNEFLSAPIASAAGRKFVTHTATQLENRRTFFFYKGDPFGNMDSRSSTGLFASIDLMATAGATHVKVRGKITNVGQTTWLPSFSGNGAVNIGVHLLGADGRLVNLDYARFALSSDRVPRGQSRDIDLEIPNPEGLKNFDLVIDLVAEGIAWFEILGTSPTRFRISLDGEPHIERIS
jgi:ubiquinone/menaquinone biosynthesis C-methylase UbiE